jgi:Sec-independent protein translocase protein TatA
MLGVSFPELAVFLCVALLVLGPEKTLKASRSMGRAFSKIRGYLRECERELDLGDLRKASAPLRGSMLDLNAAAGKLEECGPQLPTSGKSDAAPAVAQGQSGAAKHSWPRPHAYEVDDEIKALQGRVDELEREIASLKGQSGSQGGVQ